MLWLFVLKVGLLIKATEAVCILCWCTVECLSDCLIEWALCVVDRCGTVPFCQIGGCEMSYNQPSRTHHIFSMTPIQHEPG